MGLLKHVLFWPVTAPMFLIDFSFGQIEGVVRQELTDDTPIKAELMELQLLLELGDIDDEEYTRRESLLMGRLRDVRQWREQLGMGVAGGVVRVAGSGAADVEEMQQAEAGAGAAGPGAEGKARGADDGPRVADPGSATVDIHFDWD